MEPGSHQATLDGILRDHPEALVAALDESGFIVPMSAGLSLPAGVQEITTENDKATCAHVAAPQDTIAVVTCWERSKSVGIGTAHVRLVSDSTNQVWTLTILDTRATQGSRIAVFCLDGAQVVRAQETPDTVLAVARRSRTAVLHKSHFAVILWMDERITSMLGWEPGSLIGRRGSDLCHPDDLERVVGSWMEVFSTGVTQRVRFRHLCQDGNWLWIEAENARQETDDENGLYYCTLTDISDEMAAHDAVYEREELFRRLAESLPSGLLQVAADLTVRYSNSRLAKVLGVAEGADLPACLDVFAEHDRAGVTAALHAAAQEGSDLELEAEIRRPDNGKVRRCLVTMVALTDAKGATGAIMSITDVTESARLREDLRVQATFDALTGCHNRAATMYELERALSNEQSKGVAVLFIDLDRFKAVNDELGHAAGDALLIEVANRLKDQVRDRDTVGRIGGDEFLLICPGVPDAVTVHKLAARVRVALDAQVPVPGGVAQLSASVGVAIWRPGLSSDALVAEADTAMYSKKQSVR
jgi:diguanylate cyclase (GGDEF)-like protein/PAS domain S-box-containing protein